METTEGDLWVMFDPVNDCIAQPLLLETSLSVNSVLMSVITATLREFDNGALAAGLYKRMKDLFCIVSQRRFRSKQHSSIGFAPANNTVATNRGWFWSEPPFLKQRNKGDDER